MIQGGLPQGPLFRAALKKIMAQVNVEIVKRSEQPRIFLALPGRWGVEVSASDHDRLARDGAESKPMVGAVGIEPTTPSMSPRCSAAELSARPIFRRPSRSLAHLRWFPPTRNPLILRAQALPCQRSAPPVSQGSRLGSPIESARRYRRSGGGAQWAIRNSLAKRRSRSLRRGAVPRPNSLPPETRGPVSDEGRLCAHVGAAAPPAHF